MGKLVILRGVAGSGKSTIAGKMELEAKESGKRAIICSADDYFVCDGKYEFDSSKLPEAHSWCLGMARAALELETDLVIVDNTNLQRWEFRPYEEMAIGYQVECQVIVVGTFDDESIKLYASRNTHNIPFETIKRMAKKFQP